MILYGASGHGKVIHEIVNSIGGEVTAYIDDNPEITRFHGCPVYRFLTDVELMGDEEIIVSIGKNETRKRVVLGMKVPFGRAIHTTCVLSTSATVGEGSVLMSNTSINASTYVGRHCIVNTNASVDHDCIIGDFVHLSPNVALAGGVKVGEGAHIGIGACVIQGITIGKWAIVGAGAVVIQDVPDNAVAVGNPARIIKFRS